MREHTFKADWREVDWESGHGNLLLSLNKFWKMKTHSYND